MGGSDCGQQATCWCKQRRAGASRRCAGANSDVLVQTVKYWCKLALCEGLTPAAAVMQSDMRNSQQHETPGSLLPDVGVVILHSAWHQADKMYGGVEAHLHTNLISILQLEVNRCLQCWLLNPSKSQWSLYIPPVQHSTILRSAHPVH